MTRLPNVGGDVGNWGTLLNEYLSVSHNLDGTLKNQVVNVKDFGAKGDYGTKNTDDTAAIQKAFDTITSGILFFPKGFYKITNTITLTNKKGITIQGEGKYATRIQWSATNNPNVPVIKVVNGRDIGFLDMGISGLAIGINPQGVVVNNSLPSALIEMQADESKIQSGVSRPSMCRFENLFLNEKGGANAADKGIAFTAATADSDKNNDVAFFKRVQIAQTITAGVSFEHSQSKAHAFLNCNFGDGKYGITTALGPTGHGGSFRWLMGNMGNHNIADFHLGGLNDPININGMYSEDSARLLTTEGISSTGWPVVIENIRFAANGLHADGNAIVYSARGPLVVKNSSFGGSRPSRIKLKATGPMIASITENFFNAKILIPVDPVVTEGAGPFHVAKMNNLYYSSKIIKDQYGRDKEVGEVIVKPEETYTGLLERIKNLEAKVGV